MRHGLEVLCSSLCLGVSILGVSSMGFFSLPLLQLLGPHGANGPNSVQG